MAYQQECIPEAESSALSVSCPIPLLLSGTSLEELASRIRELERTPLGDLPRIACRLAERATGEHRLAVVAGDGYDLAAQLAAAREHVARSKPSVLKTRSGVYYGSGHSLGRTAILFPGQGSQYAGMLRQLCAHLPDVEEWFRELDVAFARRGMERPSELLSTASPAEAGNARLFDLEGGAQLGLAASMALYSVLVRIGVRADFLLGHSNGEHAALMAAGVIEYPAVSDACEFMSQVALESTRITEPPMPEGVMAVGALKRHALEHVVGRHAGVYIAVDNCPTQVVLAGHRAALQDAASEMRKIGGICSWLPFTRAHHTPLFDDWTRLLEKHYDALPGGSARAIVYSCGTAQEYPAERGQVLRLLAHQWSGPVRFRESIEALYDAGARIFIEAGPDNRLTPFVDDTLRGKPHRTLSASTSSRSDFEQLAHLVAELYCIGVPVSLGIFPGCDRAKNGAGETARAAPRALKEAILQEHDLTSRLAGESASRIAARLKGYRVRIAARKRFPLLGEVRHRDSAHLSARRMFMLERDQFLLDHCLGRGSRGELGAPLPVVAFTMSLEMAAEAACCLSGMPARSLSTVRAHSWLAVEGGMLTVDIEAEARGSEIPVRIFAVSDTNRVLSFEAVVECGTGTARRVSAGGQPAGRPPARWSRDDFYSDFAFHGPSFQGIERVEKMSEDGIAARIRVTELLGLPQESLQADPAMLDCAGQLAALWCLEQGGIRVGAYPFAQQRLTICAPPEAPGVLLQCHGAVRRTQFGTLSSDFEFTNSTGRVIARLEKLEQRLVVLPDAFWGVVFGRDPVPVALARLLRDRTADWNVLTGQSAIWARAFAHLVLTPEEFREWRKLPEIDAPARLRALVAERVLGNPQQA
jgi:acyl transferase domain-containing protein